MSATILLKSVDIHIPGYRIIRPIGEGGMASVFLATQESLDREVALKVMAPALAANAEFTERFVKEGKITAKLNHPNLVTVFDIGSHGTVYYLAAEYIPGGTLREKINEGLSVAETLDIICDVARGLHFAHQKGFVHRDVKPGNILFKADGTAVLADFGIAKAMDAKSSHTMAGSSIGTPDYMSPEQARAEQVDGRSDLYSMGVMLYEMLTGEAPYQASDPFTVALMHVTQPLPTLPAEHEWLQPLIEGLMAKVPDNRFATGEAFITAVEQTLAASPQSASIQQQRASKKRAGGSRLAGGSTTRTVLLDHTSGLPKWAIPAGAAAVVLLVAGAWWMFAGDGSPTDPVPTDPAATTTDPTTSPNAVVLTRPEDLPPEVQVPSPVDARENDIDYALEQADAYKDFGINKEKGRKLIFPEDDSAVFHYRKALAIDPDNARAKQGLEEIAQFYVKNAKALCERQLWTVCVTTAQDGLKADPENAELQRLLQSAQQASIGG